MQIKQQGLTIIELLVTITILALLTSIGLPSFKMTIEATRVRSQVNGMLAGLRLARSEAIKRSEPVTFASNNNVDWSNGWVIGIDQNDDGQLDQSNDLLIKKSINTNKITPLNKQDLNQITFTSRGNIDQATTFVFQRCAKGSNLDLSLNISASGRASTSKVPCP